MNVLPRSTRIATAGSLLWREWVQGAVRQSLAGSLNAEEKMADWRRLVHDALRCLSDHPEGTPPVRAIREKRYDRFRVQSLVLESFPGWQVGLNLYLPLASTPAVPILCPCGHGVKWSADHQTAPQVLASNGFAAALFDMPMFGEKTRGNDHFIQGAQALMVGRWSNYYFLIDAVRVLDYLESRPDIDLSGGAGITGVSGGGSASIMLPLVDRRIQALAPACCLTSFNGHLAEGLYTGCLENYIRGQAAAGLDLHRLLALNAPTPALVMAGEDDDMFRPEQVLQAYREVEAAYAIKNAGDHIHLFMDNCRHQYTERMAGEAAAFFGRWLRAGVPLSGCTAPVTLLPEQDLDCGTADSTLTMADDIRRRVVELRSHRQASDVDLANLLRIPSHRPKDDIEDIGTAAGWGAHDCRRVILHGSGMPLPVIVREAAGSPDGVMVAVTDGDKFALVRDGSCLAGQCCTLVAGDIRGFGELRPEPSDYDVYSWCSIDRALCDLLYVLDETALGQQCLDVLRLVDYACASTGVSRVPLYGEGESALAVFFATLLHPAVTQAVLVNGLGSFEALATETAPVWKRYAFLPDVLKHGDLGEFATAHPEKRFLMISPRDGAGAPLSAQVADRLFSASCPGVRVVTGPVEAWAIARHIKEWRSRDVRSA